MRRSLSLIGLIGLILLFFGVASLFLAGGFSIYTLFHLAAGFGLVGYYLAGSFRDLGQLLSARSTKYGANMVVYSVLFLALLAGINWLGVRYNRTFDMTEQSIFSLSPQARSVIEGVNQNIQLQAFLEAGQNPQIEDILATFGRASERVKIEVIDPDRQPDLTQKYGVRTYNTVRVAYGDQATTVSQPTEESITNAVIKVTHATKKNVYFLQGQGQPGIDDLQTSEGYGQIKQDLANESYEVKPLILLQQGSVPEDADMLVVVGTEKPLLEQEVAAIRAYLGRGGRAVFLLPPETGDELKPLLLDYGITLGGDVVLDRVVRLFEGPGLDWNPITNTYGAHPITKELRERTVFPLTRSVTPTPGEPKPGMTVTSIVKSSQSSWAETDLTTLFDKGEAELTAEIDTQGPVSIAVATTAKLNEPAGEKPASEDPQKAPEGGEPKGEARLVVFGTGQLADNKYVNMLYNRDLFMNTLGWLAGQEELLSIRPRTMRASRVHFSEEQATSIFYLSVLVLPELLLLIGLAVWWRRSRL